MSNLSKTFKVGGLVIAIAMMLSVAAVASAQTTTTTTTVVASGYTYSGVMKAGMSGPGISTLQAALNEVNVGTTVVVDGKFGPATKAAVMKFQMNHGLTADGVVGPKTGAALTAATVAVITVPSNFPAGCTSNAGFSTTTGMSCAVSLTLPAGCTSTAGYSSTTGVKCSTSSSSSNLPAGCTSTSGFSSTTGARCDSGSSSNNDGSLSGGETSISDVNVNDADDDSVNEGANKAPVAQIEFDVDDADAELVRADVVFQAANGADEEKPWRVFDKAYLLNDDGDVLASVSADDEDVWDEADDVITGGTEQAYRLRFNDVGEIFDEDSTASLWVAVDVSSSVDGSEDGADWTVGLDTDGLRFTDSSGLDTEEDSSDTASFTIEEAGAQSDFNVTEADNSPDAQTLEVDETSTAEQTLAIFTVDTDEDGGDVKINDFPVGIKMTVADGSNTTFVSDFDDVISDVYVTIDGVKYTGDYESNTCDGSSANLSDCTAGQTATFRFDDIEDDDIVVDAGDSIDVKVSVKFRSQGSTLTNYANGTTIQAFAQVDDSDVEDADSGDDIGDVDGSAEGEVMTLAGTGIMVEVNDATTTVTEIDGVLNDTVTFSWNIDITAFGNDDVYVNADFVDIVQTADDNGADVDMVYDIESSDGVTTALDASDSGTITDNSDAQEVTGDNSAYGATYNGEIFYRISEGSTETFTITVSATNGNANKQVRAFLSEIEFTTDQVDAPTAQDAATPTISSYTANLAEDSRTPFKAVQ